MTEIKINVDFDNREIHGIECDHENKFEVAKVLLDVASTLFGRITMRTEGTMVEIQ